MTRKLDKAVEERIQKATNTWKHVGRKIFRNKAFIRKIKIVIMNSLIRRTMIYGLRTRDTPKHLMGDMEVYMHKQIRTTINPNWKTAAWYPGKTNSTENYNNRR